MCATCTPCAVKLSHDLFTLNYYIHRLIFRKPQHFQLFTIIIYFHSTGNKNTCGENNMIPPTNNETLEVVLHDIVQHRVLASFVNFKKHFYS